MSWVNRVLGDEVDVAYEQAVKAGFPEGTARKIATGELPMDYESRMQRAREQGFVTSGLHGTNKDFMEFDKSKIGATDTGTIGEGFYFADRPSMANRYARGEGANVIPVLLKTDNPSEITNPAKDIPVELKAKAGSPSQIRENLAEYSKNQSDWLRGQGHDSVIWDKGNGFKEKMVLEPNQVRSINAAFDPDNKNSANLLGFNSKKKLSTNPLDYINPQAIPQPEMKANDFAEQTWSERVNNAVFDLSTDLGASPQYAQKMAGLASGAVEFTPVQSAMDVADYAGDKGDAVSAGFGLLDLIPGVGKGVSSAAKGIVSTVENIGKGNKATPDELIRLGLLKADKAPTEKIIQNAQEKFKDLYAKPFYREVVEGARANNYETVFNKDMDVQHQIIQPEDLLGKSIVNYKSDLSDLGNVQRLDGLDTNVDVQSGTLFTPKNADQEIGWASMGSDSGKSGIANKAHQKAIDTENLTESEVVAASHIMGPQSSSFSTPVAELMLGKIQNMNLPPDLIKKFDNAMKKVKPDWVGLNSDYALAQLKGKEGFSREGSGAERKRFLQVLSMPQFRDAGFPQPDTALPVIDNPEYKDLPYGMTGVNFWLPDTSKAVYRDDALHDSYSHAMPLKPGLMGRFEAPVRFDTLNKDAFDELAGEMSKPTISKRSGKPTLSKPYTYDQKVNANTTRSAGSKGTLQTIGEKDVERISKAIKHNKMLIAKYGTLGAALMAGEAIADEGQEVSQ